MSLAMIEMVSLVAAVAFAAGGVVMSLRSVRQRVDQLDAKMEAHAGEVRGGLERVHARLDDWIGKQLR